MNEKRKDCLWIVVLCSLLLLLAPALMPVAMAQQGSTTIKGKILSADGTPLVGATINVRNTNRSTITGNNGQFELTGVTPDAVLVISFTGYTTLERQVNNQYEFTVTLAKNTVQLTDVVVVGYGTQRKIETTGSIASVKASDLTQTPVANVAQGLQARVSGVQISQNSGAPGGNISVRIRGTNSINGTSEPLYVVDGIQISNGGGINSLSPLSTINPNDIESVEVLKDASASAIYGARAANGVVLITTKRGRAGATRVVYESYFGTQRAAKKLEVLNASEFARLENEVFKNNYYSNPDSLGEGINWQDLIFRDARIQNHQLSINGGNEKTQLALSLNYFDQEGIIINSDFKRYSVRLNLDHKVSDWLKIGTSVLGTYGVNNSATTGSTAIGDGPVVTGSILGAAIGAPPFLQPYRADGSLFPFGEQGDGRYREVANPLGFASVLNQQTIKRYLINVYGSATITKGLTYRASFNADLQSSLNDYYSPRSIVNKADLNDNSGSASKGNSNFTAMLHESILTYATRFGEDHTFKTTAVFAAQVETGNSNTINANGFPNDVTKNEALQLALNRTVSSYRSKQQLESYMARVNYGFRDKYFLDVTARIDGSSKFGANNKYGLFPAVAAAWRVSEEPFLQNLDWLSDLKLRGSFGVTGNAGGIEPYQSLPLVAGTGGDYNINHTYYTGINPTGIANEELKWEKSSQANIGVDISLFRNRVNAVVEYYHKRTNDLLYVMTLPLSSGYSTITGNFASMQNKGVELSANAKVLDGGLKWNIAGNITFNRNKVMDLDGGVTNERFITAYSLLKVGSPLGVFKTYVFDGINQTGDVILPGYDGRVGGYKVEDLNKDGAINSNDQKITGDPNPDFIYGFSTDLSFKNFDFSAFFSGTQGNEIYNAASLSFEMPLGQRNMYKGLVNRWTPTNPSNEYVSAFQGGRLPITNNPIEDGSYLRCRNITLGYTLPKMKGIRNLRVYISANNLFTVTNYSGFDPEVNTYAGSNTAIGVDNLVYPQARTFLGGVQLAF